MKNGSGLLILPLVLLIAGAVVWATRMPRQPAPAVALQATRPVVGPLRIGIVPERDIYAQRRRYRALGDYLSPQIGRPVDIVTVNTYGGVLVDLKEKQIDCAFLGSLVAQMAIDQMGARPVLRPELPGGVSTYQGVIFAPEKLGIENLKQLRGRSIAMVRTTMAGHLFPTHQLFVNGLLGGPDAPRILWVGTHDEVMREVLGGQADAGAVKDLRLADFQRSHPQFKIRRLQTSAAVPENALVLRGDLEPELAERLVHALRSMEQDESGRKTLQALGAVRFIECRSEEYEPVREMIRRLGPAWAETAN